MQPAKKRRLDGSRKAIPSIAHTTKHIDSPSPGKTRNLSRRNQNDSLKDDQASHSNDAKPSGDQTADVDEVQISGSKFRESTQKTFADLGIIDSLCEACTTLGYKAPTP